MQKVVDYFVNGNFEKRVVRTIPEEKLEPIGEILTSPKFEDMVYEDRVKGAIQLVLNKIKKENVNLLLYGTAGTGKTTTAKMLAVESDRPFIYLTGSMAQKKIVKMLLSAKENSIVLIDEIHNLPEKIGEIIYPAIQDGEIYSEGERKILKNVMFIGTTTEPQGLAKPLMDRFKSIELEELSGDKLREVLGKKGCPENCANYLLNFTTNFRIIHNLLDLTKLYGEVNEQNLVKVFRLKGINLYSGLSNLQEEYMKILKGKKMGLRNISLMLRKSEDYIKFEIEPDLIRKGYVSVSSKGRELNPEFQDFGYEQLKKEGEKHHAKFTQEERESAINWLKENKQITEKIGKRYFELVNMIAEQLHEGFIPDDIDWGSFADDKPIKESFKDNYLEEL